MSQAPSDQARETTVQLLTWNVQAASAERARRQVDWLAQLEGADVIVLTELPLRGSVHAQLLQESGFTCVCPPPNGDRRVLIGARRGTVKPLAALAAPWAHRLLSVEITLDGALFDVIGVYVPSRGPAAARNVAKRAVQLAVAKALSMGEPGCKIVMGDLNVVEPGHQPAHAVFGAWEYAFYRSFAENGYVDAFRISNPTLVDHSWFGHSGKGYRFDHAFAAASLTESVFDCRYDHEPRLAGLSDHAPLTLTIRLPATSNGPTSPAT